MSAPDRVIVGYVRNVHGLKGELVVEPHTDDPDEVFSVGRSLTFGTVRSAGNQPPIQITGVRPFKGGYLVKFAGIDDRTEAERWRDRYLYAGADELTPLDEGEVYLHELKGMRVELENGEEIGSVIEVYELPQGLVLDVGKAGAKSIMIPYDRVVTEVDRAARVIRIDPPEGLIE